ncbi:MAG: glycosyltransferase family 4 protein [Acidobacteriia bacterium]|nr:glycosyltransferase family 4 protein [Terriglobia bacterium]
MKILYVSHLFLPKSSRGTEIYTFNAASEMKRRGHEVHVLTCESFKTGGRNEVRAEEDLYCDLKVHRMFLNARLMDKPARSEYFNPHVEKHLMEYFQKVRPDVIHAIHFAYLTTAVVTAAQKLDIPVIFTATDFWMLCPNSQLLRWNSSLCDGPTNIADCFRCYTHLAKRGRKYRGVMKLLPDSVLTRLAAIARSGEHKAWHWQVLQGAAERARWNLGILNSLDYFIAPSLFLERMFVQNGLTNPHRMHLPFGLDSGLLNAKSEKSSSADVRFGFIGTISKHKGLHLLIEALRGIPRSAAAILRVYGSWETDPLYGDEIARLAEGDPRIRFEGTFPHEEIQEVFRNIDVLVVPSVWYENTPLVIYTALALRTPVICSNLGGMAEVVSHEKNGLTFEVGNVEALRGCLRRFLNEPELGENLRPQRGSVASIEENIEELIPIYRGVERGKNNPASSTPRNLAPASRGLDE